jgi:hypothetical protein
MLGARLKLFAKSGIRQREGNCPALADKALKQAVTSHDDIHLPIVSSSTGAAMTTVIRSH